MTRGTMYLFVFFLFMGVFTAAWGAATEKGSLEGTWIAKTMEKDGKKAPEEAVKRMSYRFAGDKLFVKGNFENDRVDECSFVLDGSREPKQLDFTPPKAKKAILAIYERKGDALKICMRHSSSDKGRPTEFKTTPDSALILIVFTLKTE